MTGHGQATTHNSQFRVVAEIRSVNNRFLKTVINCDLNAEHHSKIETLVKQSIKRGSVNVRLKTYYEGDQQTYKLNSRLIQTYWTELSEIASSSQSINVESLLQLPGVVEETVDESIAKAVWPVAEKAVIKALAGLNHMRVKEGEVMKADLLTNSKAITTHLDSIKELAPNVVEAYAKKMTDRINALLAKHDVSIEPTEIVREVGIFAEKCDISEEIIRLGSHLSQFENVVQKEPNSGKKLEFLVQEMLRETNTIGSKANHVEISNRVVEIKTSIERIREMVQNVE